MNQLTVPLLTQGAAYEAQWLTALGAALPAPYVIKPLALCSAAEKHAARVAIVANPRLDEIAQLPNLVWVQSLWAGVEKILHAPQLAHLQIARLIDPALAQSMAQSALAWVLFLHHNIPQYQAQQAQGVWRDIAPRAANNQRVSIFGLGEMGQARAALLQAYGFRVQAYSRQAKIVQGVQCFAGAAGLRELLPQTDIALSVLPATPATENFFNAAFFEAMPRGASLINFGRGSAVDDAALITALDSGQLAHAVLDVFRQEPLPANNPFWAHPNITVLPHIAAPTTPQTAASIAAQAIVHYFQTQALPAVVDREQGY